MIEILFFGRMADLTQSRSRRYDGAAGGLFALRDEIFAAALSAGHIAPTDIRMSVNRVQTFEDQPLHDGDEVAFFPVFSGG